MGMFDDVAKVATVANPYVGMAVEAGKRIGKATERKKVDQRTPRKPSRSSRSSREERSAKTPKGPGIPQAKAGKEIQVDPRAIEALRNEALAPSSESPWLKNQLQQMALQRQQGLGEAAQMEATNAAQGRAALAMRGGLTGGAAERLAMGSNRDAMMARQGVNRQAQMGGLAAAQSAEENRMNTLRALPGMEVQQTQPGIAQRGQDIGVSQWNVAAQLDKMRMDEQARQAEGLAQSYEESNKPPGGDIAATMRNPISTKGYMTTNPWAAPVAAGTGALKKAGVNIKTPW